MRVAIDIADADGMAELSMRRIATELGVATMSLYRRAAGAFGTEVYSPSLDWPFRPALNGRIENRTPAAPSQ